MQTLRVHELSVVSGNVGGTGPACSLPTERDAAGGGIASVKGAALNDTESRGAVGYRSSVRTDRILGMRDGHNAGATYESHGRLEGGDAVGIPRANNAAVRLGA